jgi:hypothetical protein
MSQFGGENLFKLASRIRLPNEDWQAAVQRARAKLPSQGKAPRKPRVSRKPSGCVGRPVADCHDGCGWVNESKPYKTAKGKSVTKKAHCAAQRSVTVTKARPMVKPLPMPPMPTYGAPKPRVHTKRSECAGLSQTDCINDCYWTQESKPIRTTKGTTTRKAHCSSKPLPRFPKKMPMTSEQRAEETYESQW